MEGTAETEALQYALNRVAEFAVVQKGRPLPEQLESIAIVQESLGFNDESREILVDWMEGFIGEVSGEVLLGIIIGLFMMQHNLDAT